MPSQIAAPAAPIGQSPTRRPTFWYALPPPGTIAILISVSSSPGATTVSYGPVWNSLACTVLVPVRFWITMVAFSAANAADRSSDGSAWHSDPADGAPQAHDRVGDHPLRVVQDGEMLTGDGGVEQLGVPGHGADPELAVGDLDIRQVGQAVDVDQRLGLGQPELHHRDQAVSPGQDPGLRAEPREQRQRVIHAGRLLVLDICRNLHAASP